MSLKIFFREKAGGRGFIVEAKFPEQAGRPRLRARKYFFREKAGGRGFIVETKFPEQAGRPWLRA